MANSKNVKMLLVLPNNDQETFVNSINYNFHQLANLANGIVTIKGDTGERGLPGTAGKKGDSGADGTKMYAYIGDDTEDAYKSFVLDNKITPGDFIITKDGKFYKYEESHANIADYVCDIPATDLSKVISDSVKTSVGEMQSVFSVVGKGSGYCVMPKSLNDIDSNRYADSPFIDLSLPSLFTSGISTKSGGISVAQDNNFYNFSINSMISSSEKDYYNIRIASGNNWGNYSKIRYSRNNTSVNYLDFDVTTDSDISEFYYKFRTISNKTKFDIIIGNSEEDTTICGCISVPGKKSSIKIHTNSDDTSGITATSNALLIKNTTDNSGKIKIEQYYTTSNPSNTGIYIGLYNSANTKKTHFSVEESGISMWYESPSDNYIKINKTEYGTVPPDGTNPKRPSISSKSELMFFDSTIIDTRASVYRMVATNAYIGYSKLVYTSVDDLTFRGIRVYDYNANNTVQFRTKSISIYCPHNFGTSSDKDMTIINNGIYCGGSGNESNYGVSNTDEHRSYILSTNSAHIASSKDVHLYGNDKVYITDSECDDYLHTKTRLTESTISNVNISYYDNISDDIRTQFSSFLEENDCRDDRYISYISKRKITANYKILYYKIKDVVCYRANQDNYITPKIAIFSCGKTVIIDVCGTTTQGIAENSVVVVNIEAYVFSDKYNYYYNNGSTQNNELLSLKAAFNDDCVKFFRENKPSRGWRSILKDYRVTGSVGSIRAGFDGVDENTGWWNIDITINSEGDYYGQLVLTL